MNMHHGDESSEADHQSDGPNHVGGQRPSWWRTAIRKASEFGLFPWEKTEAEEIRRAAAQAGSPDQVDTTNDLQRLFDRALFDPDHTVLPGAVRVIVGCLCGVLFTAVTASVTTWTLNPDVHTTVFAAAMALLPLAMMVWIVVLLCRPTAAPSGLSQICMAVFALGELAAFWGLKVVYMPADLFLVAGGVFNLVGAATLVSARWSSSGRLVTWGLKAHAIGFLAVCLSNIVWIFHTGPGWTTLAAALILGAGAGWLGASGMSRLSAWYSYMTQMEPLWVRPTVTPPSALA